ncbi:MAG: thioredoxin family protein [Pseudomonadota bacterium]|nr:thioredoxin family protein [Pseudomonadota bacterium]
MAAALLPGDRLLVACLCADWCGSCREYRPTFDALAERFARQARFVWLDVEDAADALGDPEIENFPTLLISRDGVPLFFGPVTPQPQTAERLVRGALAGDFAPVRNSAAVELARRVEAASSLPSDDPP